MARCLSSSRRKKRCAGRRPGWERIIFPLILEVKAADLAAQSDYRREEKRCLAGAASEPLCADREEGDCLTLKELAVTGRDLMEAGMKPGPGLGQALQSLLETVLEDPEKNTKEYLLSLLPKET